MKGRLRIIDTLHEFIVNDTPETASPKSPDNLHDLIARMPWLLNNEWELYDEEKTISTQLKKWNAEEDIVKKLKPEEARMRYDFIAFSGKGELVIVEIKRSGHPVELEEMSRLLMYKEKLSLGYRGKVKALLICSGNFNVTPDTLENFKKRDDFEILTWAEVCSRTKTYYEHYRGILEGNVGHKDFQKKLKEVQGYKIIKETGSVKRTIKERRKGLGPK
jgi:hypothetical protein